MWIFIIDLNYSIVHYNTTHNLIYKSRKYVWMNKRCCGWVRERQHGWWHNIMSVSHSTSLPYMNFSCWWLFVSATRVMKWWTELAGICSSPKGWVVLHYADIFKGRVPPSSKGIFFVCEDGTDCRQFSTVQFQPAMMCHPEFKTVCVQLSLPLTPSRGYETFPSIKANLSLWGALKYVCFLFIFYSAVAHNYSQ